MRVILTVVVAVLYAWIGVAAPGAVRILGLSGATLILTALVLVRLAPPARGWRAAAAGLLLAGVLLPTIPTWWSVVTPVLAVLGLTFGWSAIRRAKPVPAVSQAGGRHDVGGAERRADRNVGTAHPG